MGMFSAKDLMNVTSTGDRFAEDGENNAVKVVEKADKPVANENVMTGTNNAVASDNVVPVQVPPGGEEEETFEGLSNEELLGHSNWKARKIGYTKVAPLIKSKEFGSLDVFRGCLKEGSMGAMDTALDCCRAYVENMYDGSDDGELIQESIPLLLKKALVGRPSTKTRGVELVLDFMQVNSKTCLDTTLAALLPGLNERNPKVGVATVTCYREAAKAFGGRRLPLAHVQDCIVKGLAVKSPLVKKEAKALAVDINVWYKGAFKDIVIQVVDSAALKKDLEKTMEDAVENKQNAEVPTATRVFRGEDESSQTSDAGEPAGGEVDMFDALPEKAILNKLQGIGFEKRIKEAKWVERKNAVADVVKLCGNPPKLAKGDYTDLVRTLRSLIQKDSNQAVVVQCIQLLGVLGAGLRSDFLSHAKICSSPLLFKYRDKKMPLISAVDTALDCFAKHCFDLTDEKIIHVIQENLSSGGDSGKVKSTPLQRTHIYSWISRSCLEGLCWKRKDHASEFSQLLQSVVDGVTDADPAVRDICVKCLGGLHRNIASTPKEYAKVIEETVEQLLRTNPKLKSKLMDNSEKPGPPAEEKVPKKTKPVDTSKPATTTKPLLKRAPKKAAAPVVSSNAVEDDSLNASGPVIGDEEATQLIVEKIDGIQDAIKAFDEAKKWQDKLGVFEAIQTYLSSSSDSKISTCDCEAIVVFIGTKTKQFKENNFNVMNAAWTALQLTVAASTSPPFGKGYANLLFDPAIKKFGDRKQSGPVSALLLQLCEPCNPKFISGKLLKASEKIVAPKALEDIFSFFKTVAQDFGVQHVNLKGIVEFAAGPKGLESRQMGCKKAATECLGEMYRQAGPPVKQLLSDSANAAVEEEFKKVGYDGPVKEAKRKIQGSKTEDSGAPEAVSFGDLVPRADLTSLLTPKLLENLGDETSKSSWKIRMKAIDDIVDIIHGAKGRVQINHAVKVTASELRKRFADSNRNLVTKAITAMGLLGNSVGGDGAASLAKGTGTPLLNCLSGGKKPAIVAVEKTLEQWTVHDDAPHQGAFFGLVHQCPAPLMDSKNDRKVILRWFIKYFDPKNTKRTPDIDDIVSDLVGPFLNCLQSRDPTERKLSIQCVALMVEFMGHEEGEARFQAGCRDLKPAVARGVTPLLKSAYEQAGAGGGTSLAATSNAPTMAPTSKAGKSETLKVEKASTVGAKKPGARKLALGKEAKVSRLARETVGSPKHDEPAFKPVSAALRERREEQGRRKRWPAHFDEKDKRRLAEYTQGLRDSFERIVSADLLSKMFTDANDGRAARGSALDPAFQTLMQELPNYGHEAMEAFDLLLKWCTIHLLNNNSTVTSNLLQLLDMMFELASGADYTLSDYEAAAFLPHLLNRLGDKQKRFREGVRSIMTLLCKCYPYSKYTPYVYNEISPHQRSAFILSECLDELARLTRWHGLMITKIKVGVGNNLLKRVVSFVDDQRKEVRSAALLVLEQIWEHCDRSNDALFKLFAQHKAHVSDKSKTLIENSLSAAAARQPTSVEDVPQPEMVDEGARVAPVNRTLKLNTTKPTSPPRQKQTFEVESPGSPSTPDVIIRKRKPSSQHGTALFEVDLPATPPSPSDRKRFDTRTPNIYEKENDPATDTAHAMFHASLLVECDAASSPKLVPGKTPIKYVKMVDAIADDTQAYLGLLKEQVTRNDEETMLIRNKGIMSLALLGSKEPPAGWIESGFGQHKEWVSLLVANADVRRIMESLLELVSTITTPVLGEDSEREIQNSQQEIRLLKLVLPAIFTLGWWRELRNTVLAKGGTGLGAKWVEGMCNLVSRLMQQKVQQADIGSEEIHEIQTERDRLLKTAQTIFAKLSESAAWLPTVLRRIRMSNDYINKATTEDFSNEENRLKQVLRSSLREFVALQESLVDPYHEVDMAATVEALNGLLLAASDSQVHTTEDQAAIEVLVESLLKTGKRFTQHFPVKDFNNDPSADADRQAEKSALRVLVAKLLLERTGKKGQPNTAITDAEKNELTAIFSRISEAINSSNKDNRDTAIADLFKFVDSHPGFSPKEYLQDSSAWFQQYILDELAKRQSQRHAKPLKSAQAPPLEATSLNVASIRERIGKLRKDYVKTMDHVVAQKTSGTSSREVPPSSTATLPTNETVPLVADKQPASEVITLESIRERMAAGKRPYSSNRSKDDR
eukprot:CAMPEP_0203757462 /NCGR_PEP_ID=MMETSP0098-20131031/10516_1 /ASSEMBLY_ACC=CAM_ASM_000208 /TAXON_ID=96639 /ORGANISM=" , Strain NY0313808BC1" /LENGTH=2168 /DNA_ID=CAMNT_0050649675 /DNA_START=353 /DNA_END=6856 /DNA_ORIENTATION=-